MRTHLAVLPGGLVGAAAGDLHSGAVAVAARGDEVNARDSRLALASGTDRLRDSSMPSAPRQGALASRTAGRPSPNTPRPKTTINDIARLSGVSKKTVSRIINNSPLVREDTREKVRGADARSWAIAPDPMARGLAFRRSFLIGMVYDNPNARVHRQHASTARSTPARHRLRAGGASLRQQQRRLHRRRAPVRRCSRNCTA